MYDIINEKTKLDGAGPWNTDITTFTGNTLLDLWANAPSDKVEIIRVLQKDGAVPTTNNQMCCVKAGTGATITAAKPLQRCKDGKAYDAALDKDIHSLTIPAGSYIFKFSGAGFAANGTRMTAANTDRKSCDCDCLTAPVQAVTPPDPVTKIITPCPTTFPMVWDYDGASYPALGAFVNAYKAAMLPVAVTFTAPCTFSAPAGTVFLPTALSVVPVVPPASSFALGGTGTPLPCPVVYPVTYNGNAYNSLATLKSTIETDQSVTLAYNAANCTFTQTGGVGTFTNPNVTAATVVAVTPCPPAFPMVWTVDGATYPSLSAFKAAFDAYYSVTSQYSTTPTCQLTILTGDVSPLPVASLTATNKLVLSPCPTFPAQWNGQVYATVIAFTEGVAAQGTGWSYNISTCTINAPQGVPIPPVPTAAPTAPITGIACPIVYPVVYPATTGIAYANQVALDAAIEAQLGVSVTVSSAAPCQVVQTGGAVGLLPASVVVSAVPVAAPVCVQLSNPPIDIVDTVTGQKIGLRVERSPACPADPDFDYAEDTVTSTFITWFKKTPGTVNSINFNVPWEDINGTQIGYLPY
jgi:hypothetical protein